MQVEKVTKKGDGYVTRFSVCSRMLMYAHECARMQVEKVTQEGDGYVTLFSTPSGSKKVQN